MRNRGAQLPLNYYTLEVLVMSFHRSAKRCIRPLTYEKLRFFLLVLCLLLMGQHAAYAGFQERLMLSISTGVGYPIEAGLSGETEINGNRIPTLAYDDWGAGFHFGGGMGYILDNHQKYAISATLDYTFYKRYKSEIGIVRNDRTLEFLTVFVDFKTRLRPENATVRPYLKGGIGAIKTEVIDVLLDISIAETRMGFSGAVGIDLVLSNRAGLFVETQYQMGWASAGTSQNLPVKIGLFVK